MALIPPLLKPGDAIDVVAPGFLVQRPQLDWFRQIASEMFGLFVVEGTHLFEQEGPFAGSHAHRLHDLSVAMKNTNSKAIFFARGGYGMSGLMPHLPFKSLEENPKWVLGFSDATILLNHWQKWCPCIHGPVARGGQQVTHQSSIIASLNMITQGTLPNLHWQAGYWGQDGVVKGHLIGGNLSLVANSVGTPYQPDFKNAVLVLEEVNEQLYHIDRMLWQLNNAGLLKQLAGLVVGDFSPLKNTDPPWESTIQEVVMNHFRDFYGPIAFNAPIGHGEVNRPLVFGMPLTFTVNEGHAAINYTANLQVE